jgi:hypothetical protein
MDIDILLYYVYKSFDTLQCGTLSKTTKKYIEDKENIIIALDQESKKYYFNYATRITMLMLEYYGQIHKICAIENEEEKMVNFTIFYGDNMTTGISLDHKTINIKNILPERLLKFCKIDKCSETAAIYNEKYEIMSNEIYKRIKKYTKYSDISREDKKWMCNKTSDLFMDVLSDKREYIMNLYNHIFNEMNRLVIKTFSNRFYMYDFAVHYDKPTDYEIQIDAGVITIIFDNEFEFTLTPMTNGTQVKRHISMKFNTKFINMDRFYQVGYRSLITK